MYQELLRQMTDSYKRTTGISPKEATDIHIRLQVVAGELAKLYDQVEGFEKQIVPQTSSGKYLDMHGEMRGIPRKKGINAAGILVFSRPTPGLTDVTIPRGTLAATNSNPEIYFETTVPGTLQQGATTVNIPASALLPGLQGNVKAGRIQVLVSTPAGISKVVNDADFHHGVDDETEDNYRKRVVACYQNSSTGNNKNFYYQHAIVHPNVAKARIIPQPRGLHTVDTVITCFSKEKQQETQLDLSKTLNAEKAIGVHSKVVFAVEKPVSFHITIMLKKGQNFSQVQAFCQNALAVFMDDLDIGQPVLLSHVGALLLSVDGVENYRFTSPSQDLFPLDTEICVLENSVISL